MFCAAGCLFAMSYSEAGAPHGKPFPAQGGLFADQAIQLLQQFYVCGNPLGEQHPQLGHGCLAYQHSQ